MVDMMVTKLHDFVVKTPKNIPVVLIATTLNSDDNIRSNGNAALFIPSDAEAAARAAEEFLRYGFHVVYLCEERTCEPFCVDMLSKSMLLESLVISENSLVLQCPDLELQERVKEAIRSSDLYTRRGCFLKLSTPPNQEYDSALQACVRTLHERLAPRARLLLYLTAGPRGLYERFVSTDENSDSEGMALEIFQCTITGGPTPVVDEVVQNYLAWVMKKGQYHVHGTMNQFRNQALRGSDSACEDYTGREAQLAEDDARDAAKVTRTDQRGAGLGFLASETAGVFAAGAVCGALLLYAFRSSRNNTAQ